MLTCVKKMCRKEKGLLRVILGLEQAGGGAPRDGEGQCAIASEGYLSGVEVRLHNMHVHDQVLITKNDENVEEISLKQ